MKARRRRALLRVAAALGVAVVVVVAWLGVGASWWTLRANVSPATADDAWRFVPEGAALTVVAEPGRLLGAPVVAPSRPQLARVARRHGVEITLIEHGLSRTLTTVDADEITCTVATGFRLAPALLPRFAEGWARTRVGIPEGMASGATDGEVVVLALSPGVVLAASPLDAAPCLEGARAAGASPAASPRLPLDGAGTSARFELVVDERLRRRLAADLPPEARGLVAQLVRVDGDLTATDVLSFSARFEHGTEEGARVTRDALFQADLAGRLARRAGALGALLAGDARAQLALAADLPELVVALEGTTVRLTATCDAERLGRWLDRAEEALAAEAGPVSDPGRAR